MDSDLSPRDSQAVKEINWGKCPVKFMGGLRRYFDGGIRPGSFLSAVLANDLRDAFRSADPDSIQQLFKLVLFLEEEFPAVAWGSAQRFNHWVKVMDFNRNHT